MDTSLPPGTAGNDWFAGRLLAWFDGHGRRDLPWQLDRTPYRVWVSEVMLQQTQVATVVPYFERFMRRFPDVHALAAADLDEVLHLWTGLGYYARGRNLHAAARRIVAASSDTGEAPFPDTLQALTALPGIGRSTAGAILAIAFAQPVPILDANVRRVLCRFHGVEGQPGDSATERVLWSLAETHTPADRPGDYTQAIMDFGATHCRRSGPACTACPVSERCAALASGMQDRLPAAPPRKIRPTRAIRAFLVIDAGGACLLERRAAAGVWGGLWSPLERPIDKDVRRFVWEWRLDVERSAAPPPFRHSFTHYHLDVTPHYVWVRKRPPVTEEDERFVWYRPGGEQRIGLSGVARRLLAGLDARSGGRVGSSAGRNSHEPTTGEST